MHYTQLSLEERTQIRLMMRRGHNRFSMGSSTPSIASLSAPVTERRASYAIMPPPTSAAILVWREQFLRCPASAQCSLRLYPPGHLDAARWGCETGCPKLRL